MLPARNTWSVRALVWVEDYWPQLVSLIGGGGTILGAAWLSVLAVQAIPDAHAAAIARHTLLGSVPAIILYSSVFAIIIGGVAGMIRTPQIAILEQENAELKRQCKEKDDKIENVSQIGETSYSSVFEDSLQLLLNFVLKLTEDERVSLYKHDGTQFIQIARYSKNPEYCKKGRSVYPEDQGCIAEAWRSGESYLQVSDPRSQWDAYLAEHLKKKIGEQTVQHFTMPSRFYAAFAITEPSNGHKIAVIVFESVRLDIIRKDKLKQIMKTEGRRLAGLMELMKHHEPSPSLAKKSGF